MSEQPVSAELRVGRHARCNVRQDHGHTEYDAHSHRCTLNRHHGGDHDFSLCPVGNKVATR